MPDVTKAAAVLPVPLERSSYQKLIAKNPNYFGNFGTSPLKAIKVIQNDTTYEQVTCLGYIQHEHPRSCRPDQTTDRV